MSVDIKESGGFVVSVHLIVLGEDFDPAEVTRILKVEPDNSWRRGQVRKIGDSGREHIYKWSGWKLVYTTDCVDKASTSIVKLAQIASPLSGDHCVSFDFDASVDVHFFGMPDMPFCISPEALGLVGDIPIRVSSHNWE